MVAGHGAHISCQSSLSAVWQIQREMSMKMCGEAWGNVVRHDVCGKAWRNVVRHDVLGLFIMNEYPHTPQPPMACLCCCRGGEGADKTTIRMMVVMMVTNKATLVA